MADYPISELSLGPGVIGIAPMPGRSGTYQADLNRILVWGAKLVLTMTTAGEMERAGAGSLGADLRAAEVLWRHLPVADFGAPPPLTARHWASVSTEARGVLGQGGRVLAHCYGGCGRSGMALLRLMVEAGEDPKSALDRLRIARPCAVETGGQFDWAALPGAAQKGKDP